MDESYQQPLAGLISRLDPEAQLVLRCAIVRQGLTYAEGSLCGGDEGDERACLRAAALWLEQPAPTEAQTAHATYQVAKHCEQAAFFAALALAERWPLDATYAILYDAEPPELALQLNE